MWWLRAGTETYVIKILLIEMDANYLYCYFNSKKDRIHYKLK